MDGCVCVCVKGYRSVGGRGTIKELQGKLIPKINTQKQSEQQRLPRAATPVVKNIQDTSLQKPATVPESAWHSVG